MNRREFLKSLMALGAAIAVPVDLASASTEEVDVAWSAAKDAWGLFEVNGYDTLSFANFEEPTTRRDAYGYSSAAEVDVDEIERHWSLNQPIKDLYRMVLLDVAENGCSSEELDYDAIDEQVEEEWSSWVASASDKERDAIDQVIETWLDDAPDWSNEWENIYKSGTAQGAAYNHFLYEDSEVIEELGIVIIEGDCPGSSYFAAELRIPIDEANQIAEANGWQIRFVAEG
jgi:hypothetical protein